MTSEGAEAGGTDPVPENIYLCSSKESYLKGLGVTIPIGLALIVPGEKECFVCYEGEDGMLHGYTAVFDRRPEA